jgi:hypothetical protein
MTNELARLLIRLGANELEKAREAYEVWQRLVEVVVITIKNRQIHCIVFVPY